MVENVAQFAFPSQHMASHSPGPRWTRDGQNEASRQFALDLIYCWSLCGSEAWLVFGKQQNQWGGFVQGFWMDLLSNRSQELERILPGIFLLHTSCRLSMRGMLLSAIQRHMGSGYDDITKPCHKILASLHRMFCNVSRNLENKYLRHEKMMLLTHYNCLVIVFLSGKNCRHSLIMGFIIGSKESKYPR